MGADGRAGSDLILGDNVIDGAADLGEAGRKNSLRPAKTSAPIGRMAKETANTAKTPTTSFVAKFCIAGMPTLLRSSALLLSRLRSAV